LAEVEQFQRRELGVDFNDDVQEVILDNTTNRGGLIEPGNPEHGHGLADEGNAITEILVPVAKIRPER
jgi:hypothetical protein